MRFRGLVMIFLVHQSVLSCGSYNCSFGGAGELEMRLRMMEVEKIEGVVGLGEDKQTRVSSEKSMEGKWEKMEVYEGGEGVGARRQKRGIFMRDNAALARCTFVEDAIKSFQSFHLIQSLNV